MIYCFQQNCLIIDYTVMIMKEILFHSRSGGELTLVCSNVPALQ